MTVDEGGKETFVYIDCCGSLTNSLGVRLKTEDPAYKALGMHRDREKINWNNLKV